MARTSWLVVLVAVCLTVTAAAVVYAASQRPAPTIVRAERFELVDSAGKVRAVFSLSAPLPQVVSLTDREGNVIEKRVVTQAEGSVSLSLLDAKGRQRASVSLDGDGNPQVVMSDKDGKSVFTAPAAPELRMLAR